MDKKYYVYMITNEHNTALYTGVTNNLKARVSEHKSKTGSVFTQRYRATKLVYKETPLNTRQLAGGMKVAR